MENIENTQYEQPSYDDLMKDNINLFYDLQAAKRFYKALIAIVITLLILLMVMMGSYKKAADQYQILENNYRELYTELKGEE